MTAPYVPPSPHDQVFDSLRSGGIGPAPADATAVRPPRLSSTPGRVALQAVRGLGEAGLSTADLLTTAAVGASPSLAPAADQVHAFIDRTFREPMREFYGEPYTDDEHFANIFGNLVGGAAISGAVEGLAGPVNSLIRGRQVLAQPYRLMPAESNAIMPNGGTLKYIIMRQGDNTPVGFIRGALENEGKQFYVDMTSMYDTYGGFGGGANKLGARATRQLLRQLQDFHPDLETIAGDRVSGVRQTTISRLLAKRNTTAGLTAEEQKAADIASQEVRVPVPPTLRQQLFPNFSRILRGGGKRTFTDEEASLRRLLESDNPNVVTTAPYPRGTFTGDRELDAMYLNPQHLRE